MPAVYLRKSADDKNFVHRIIRVDLGAHSHTAVCYCLSDDCDECFLEFRVKK